MLLSFSVLPQPLLVCGLPHATVDRSKVKAALDATVDSNRGV